MGGVVLKVVAVWWADAWGASQWYSPDAIEHEEYKCVNVGFLIERDAKGITLMGGIGQNGNLLASHFIPKGMIRKVKTLATIDIPE